MAKQVGDIKIVGTVDDLCFYKLYGEYCVRRKSSLTSKQFWKAKAFEGSRTSCQRFGEGNALASKLYRATDENKRVYKLFCFLKSKAITLLNQGNTLLETEAILTDYLVTFGCMAGNEIVIDRSISRRDIAPFPSDNHALTIAVFIKPTELIGTG